MNFELNEDQAALAESLSRLLADRYGFEKRRALTASGAAHDEKTWAGLAELGLTALPVPEALGGFGGGARDLLPAMQAFGRSLDGAVPGERGARRHRPAPRRRRGDADTTAARHGQRRDRVGLGA
jgi:alkylation response protein AidB-like acyl-CoA dehydrogenase